MDGLRRRRFAVVGKMLSLVVQVVVKKEIMNRINLTDGELAALLARIQRNYTYDAKSGKLVNKQTSRVVKGWANCKRNGEYRYLYMNFSVSDKVYAIPMHVVVWAWHNGRFPTMQIDHFNGNGMDNHIENLREVTQSENKMNTLYPWNPNKDTGLPGVWKHGSGYRIKDGQNLYFFRDKYEAFCNLTLLGRRFK